MPEEILMNIVFLENTLASFYENIKKEPELDRARNLLEFMETHSSAHADRIMDMADEHPRPEIRETKVIDYHNDLTRSLRQRIASEPDMSKVLAILADTEESLGTLYDTLASSIESLSNHYRDIAAVVRQLAHEEYDHRDLLLKDSAKYRK